MFSSWNTRPPVPETAGFGEVGMALTEWKDGSETPLNVNKAEVDDGLETVVRPMDPTKKEEEAVE